MMVFVACEVINTCLYSISTQLKIPICHYDISYDETTILVDPKKDLKIGSRLQQLPILVVAAILNTHKSWFLFGCST
jgi:hypothetical protein